MKILAILILSFCLIFLNDSTVDNLKKELDEYQAYCKEYDEMISDELKWLKTLPLSNGAIPLRGMESGKAIINPYFSNMVAQSLIEVDGVKSKEIVKSYIYWYLDNINTEKEDIYAVEGTIYDYEVIFKESKIVEINSSNTYDSIDSYASTFIILLNSYIENTKDYTVLHTRWSDIRKVHEALLKTEYNGLTINNFSDYNRYLMDNSEVYEASLSTIEFFNNIDDLEFYNDNIDILKSHEYLSKQIPELIEKKMWSENAYHYVLFKNNEHPSEIDWKVFYPDATAQIFSITNKLIRPSSERANYLYDTFNKHYDWENLEHLSREIDGFYWGRLAYLAALMEDDQRLTQYIRNYKKSIGESREYPLYSAESAWVIKACNYRKNKLEFKSNIINKFIDIHDYLSNKMSL